MSNKEKLQVSGAEKIFASKILTVDQIIDHIGKFPRSRKVVMCHGTFDHLHVGHIRQLEFATTKADILVVSLTCDEHVAKGDYRPWVPQELRAKHLAALQFVDYVIIDNNPTPIENILKFQPDIFVKGFEYSKNGIHPKTQEEIEALNSYGGEMLFSPGDIVYSSTQILSNERPNLSTERLLTIMDQKNITFNDLKMAVENIKGTEITVLGDLIVDKYIYCAPQMGQSQEEDVPSYLYVKEEDFIGGAGVVARHLKDLGANVNFITVVGNDELARQTIRKLESDGIKVNAFVDHKRPTTVKERFVTLNGRLLHKMNKLENTSIPDDITEEICKLLKISSSQAIICSDFRHGIFNKRTISDIVTAIPDEVLKIADCQVSTRWGNILDFAGFDLITPNEREARWSLADQDTPIKPLAQDLYQKARCKYLLLKLGREGLLTYVSPGSEHRDFFYLESFANTVVDHIGAGDALLSAATATLASSGDIFKAAILGNLTAALECSKRGNIPISANELTEQINRVEESILAK